MKGTVLVTDGEQRSALAVVRSLGRAGYRCIVGSRGRSLAGASRWARLELVLPDPLAAPEAYADAVSRAVAAESLDLVLPVAEPSVLALLAARERLRPAVVPLPALDTFRRIADKAEVLSIAPEVGIAVPAQHTLASAAELDALAPSALRWPMVLKPSRSVADGPGGRVKLGVSYAADLAELRARVAALPAAAFPLLLQQRVVGPGVGIFLLRWQGDIVAQFAHRRLREKPPSGGVSVYRESITAESALVARSRALLERFDWCGVAMIEYKLDAATGQMYLMEINGRFWGSLQLAIDAGVDFPVVLAELALGGRPAPVLSYRTGVRSRWWWGDVDHLLARLRRGRTALALPPDAPGRWRTMTDFLRLWRRGDREEIWRLRDPAPFLRETLLWLRGR